MPFATSQSRVPCVIDVLLHGNEAAARLRACVPNEWLPNNQLASLGLDFMAGILVCQTFSSSLAIVNLDCGCI